MDSLYLQIGLLLGATVAASVFLSRSLQMHEPREIVKQVGVWLGIVTLVPLTAWYGTSVYSPPPDWKWYQKELRKVEEQIGDARRGEEKPDQLRKEKDKLETELDEAEKVFYRDMFKVCYPIGLLSVIVGLLFRLQVVGAGLLFGGLFTLTTGCYSYWDRMDAWSRFGSLILVLVVLLAMGTWRYWRTPTAATP
jgi:hypothetical protein